MYLSCISLPPFSVSVSLCLPSFPLKKSNEKNVLDEEKNKSLFFNDSSQPMLFCVGFWCTAQWLDSPALYKEVPSVFPGPAWHGRGITVLLSAFPMLCFTSPGLFCFFFFL